MLLAWLLVQILFVRIDVLHGRCSKCWISLRGILSLLENSRLAKINSERHQFEPRNFEHHFFVVFSHLILTSIIVILNEGNTEDYRIAEMGMTKCKVFAKHTITQENTLIMEIEARP